MSRQKWGRKLAVIEAAASHLALPQPGQVTLAFDEASNLVGLVAETPQSVLNVYLYGLFIS